MGYDKDILEDLTDADLAPVAKLIIEQLAARGQPFAQLIQVERWQLDEAIAQLEDIQ